MNTEEKTFENMDKLDKIFYMQAKFDNELAERRNLNFTSEEWIQRQTLALISEIAEVLDEVNFKWWKNPKPLDLPALKEELVDVLHFFTAMCLRAGMTSQELYDIYMNKNAENFKRQHGESTKKGYELNDVK